MLTITGRGPANRFAGMYRKPEIMRPSKDFQWINSGSLNSAGFNPPVSLVVQRVSVALSTSMEKTSDGLRAEDSDNPRSRLLWCHRNPPMVP